MQFPVGVALRDLANFAVGQVTGAISQQKSIILLWRDAAIYVGVIKYVFLKAILVLLWQNTEKDKKRSEVAGKGGKSGQSAVSGFQHAQSIM